MQRDYLGLGGASGGIGGRRAIGGSQPAVRRGAHRRSRLSGCGACLCAPLGGLARGARGGLQWHGYRARFRVRSGRNRVGLGHSGLKHPTFVLRSGWGDEPQSCIGVGNSLSSMHSKRALFARALPHRWSISRGGFFAEALPATRSRQGGAYRIPGRAGQSSLGLRKGRVSGKA